MSPLIGYKSGNTLVYGPGFSHWKQVPFSGCPLLWVFPHLGFPTSGCFLHLGAATSFYSVILCKPFLSSESSEKLLLLLVWAGFSLFSTVSLFDWYPVMCMLWPCTQRHSLTFGSINLASLVACCFKLCSSTLFLKRFFFLKGIPKLKNNFLQKKRSTLFWPPASLDFDPQGSFSKLKKILITFSKGIWIFFEKSHTSYNIPTVLYFNNFIIVANIYHF